MNETIGSTLRAAGRGIKKNARVCSSSFLPACLPVVQQALTLFFAEAKKSRASALPVSALLHGNNAHPWPPRFVLLSK